MLVVIVDVICLRTVTTVTQDAAGAIISWDINSASLDANDINNVFLFTYLMNRFPVILTIAR